MSGHDEMSAIGTVSQESPEFTVFSAARECFEREADCEAYSKPLQASGDAFDDLHVHGGTSSAPLYREDAGHERGIARRAFSMV